MVHDNGHRPSAVIASRWGVTNVRSIGGSSDCNHDVSIRIDIDGRYRGAQPRSKVSMMIMRPPQQGQGCVRICGSPSPVLSTSLGSFCSVGTFDPASQSPPATQASDVTLIWPADLGRTGRD